MGGLAAFATHRLDVAISRAPQHGRTRAWKGMDARCIEGKCLSDGGDAAGAHADGDDVEWMSAGSRQQYLHHSAVRRCMLVCPFLAAEMCRGKGERVVKLKRDDKPIKGVFTSLPLRQQHQQNLHSSNERGSWTFETKIFTFL